MFCSQGINFMEAKRIFYASLVKRCKLPEVNAVKPACFTLKLVNLAELLNTNLICLLEHDKHIASPISFKD